MLCGWLLDLPIITCTMSHDNSDTDLPQSSYILVLIQTFFKNITKTVSIWLYSIKISCTLAWYHETEICNMSEIRNGPQIIPPHPVINTCNSNVERLSPCICWPIFSFFYMKRITLIANKTNRLVFWFSFDCCQMTIPSRPRCSNSVNGIAY